MVEYLDLVLMEANINNYRYLKKRGKEKEMEKIRLNYINERASAEKNKIPGREKFLINIEDMLK